MKANQSILDLAGIVMSIRPDGSAAIVRGARQYAELMGGVALSPMRRRLAQPDREEPRKPVPTKGASS